MNNKQKALLKEIQDAFGSVQRGDGTTLHQAQAMDDYAGPEQELAARRLDTDQRWGDVPEQDIVRHYTALGFLNADGFRYYIPAHMSFAVKYYKAGSFDFLILDWILYALNPGDDPELPGWKIEQFENLDQRQKEVICHFLHFIKDEAEDYLIAHSDAEQALERYWGQFCRMGCE
jgi:hypothetical protein